MIAQARAHDLQRGVSLIELMVALLIGLILIVGAIRVFDYSRNNYRASEAVARLQETARLAMDVIETDVRMANFWGLSNRADYIINRAGPGQPAPAEFANDTQRGNASACGGAGSNWVINLDEYLGGFNNSYGLNAVSCAATLPWQGTAAGEPDTDVLVVRRANETRPVTMDTDRIYLQTSRIEGQLFVPACGDPTSQACIPAAYLPPASASRALEARAYYVSSQSVMRDDVPSLRRKRFANVNAGNVADAMLDEEIASGVEDMQVRLGVDTNDDSNIDQYVNPGAVPANGRVVSATVWLRVRAEDPDFGYVDDTPYLYADMPNPVTLNDNFRRILISRTIHIRNTRNDP